MDIKKLLRVLSYVLVALLTASLTLGGVALYLRNQPEPEVSKLDQLESVIQDYFIGDVDKVAIEDAAADAMVNALGDRWSYYIPADQYAAYQEQKDNAYVGIGVTIAQLEDGSLDIRQVTVGGPAEEAGVQYGDRIVGVNGQSILEMDLDTIKNMIKGEAETTVELTLLREGKELTVTVTRRQIKTPVATGKLLDNKIGLVTIANFNSGCFDETKAAIESLREQGAEKIIFDVRNNPGGFVHELVPTLNYLLPEGPLFRTLDYAGKENVQNSDAAFLDMPMAVLVNGESYSAAEFFAAALMEYEAAVVVGEQTCGKGYFQTTYKLPDGSAVGLSIGKYFTPKGVSLAGVGITPDVMVPVDEETFDAIYAGALDPSEDPQIQAAVAALKKIQ
jgi:carboxyl-terminal processing protease